MTLALVLAPAAEAPANGNTAGQCGSGKAAEPVNGRIGAGSSDPVGD